MSAYLLAMGAYGWDGMPINWLSRCRKNLIQLSGSKQDPVQILDWCFPSMDNMEAQRPISKSF